MRISDWSSDVCSSDLIPALRQSGTYWWHSHSGLQEQAGHYGPIVVDPAGTDPVQADRDYVLLLSEFTPLHPHTIMDKLKKGEGYFNYQRSEERRVGKEWVSTCRSRW